MKKTENISVDRQKYLRKVKLRKIEILATQVLLVIAFIAIWEILAQTGKIDSFITSQPSRILDTLKNLSTNGLLEHLWTTTYETLVGFLLGTALGIFIAIILWWSDFLAKVSEPFLVVLNSLPKVALRTNYNNLGRSRNASNNCYGFINICNVKSRKDYYN